MSSPPPVRPTLRWAFVPMLLLALSAPLTFRDAAWLGAPMGLVAVIGLWMGVPQRASAMAWVPMAAGALGLGTAATVPLITQWWWVGTSQHVDVELNLWVGMMLGAMAGAVVAVVGFLWAWRGERRRAVV